MSFQKPCKATADIPDLTRRSAAADAALPRRTVLRLLSAGTIALALPYIRTAAAQSAVKLKLSHWIPAGHPMAVWIQKWSDELKAASGGNIDIEIYPNSQLGPVQDCPASAPVRQI